MAYDTDRVAGPSHAPRVPVVEDLLDQVRCPGITASVPGQLAICEGTIRGVVPGHCDSDGDLSGVAIVRVDGGGDVTACAD